MLVITLFLILSMLVVLWLDVTRFIIPNWLVGLLLLAYPLAVWLAPVTVDWKMALAGMGIVFVIGYVTFVLNWMGGGDVKLLTACALWIGWDDLAEYVFIVAFLGGGLSLVLWLGRKAIALLAGTKPLPRILRNGEPVPYGVAIATGFLYVMWNGSVALIALG